MSDIEDQHAEIAGAFGLDRDRLAEFDAKFKQLPVDPFEITMEKVVEPNTSHPKTRNAYRRAFQHWKEFMSETGRHPACPNEHHVRMFINHLQTERDNGSKTIRGKLYKINRAYEFWQNDAGFPHPTDYNPFKLVQEQVVLEKDVEKEPPRIPREEICERVQRITNIRDRAILVLQLKLGLRATEVCNIKISEVNIYNSAIKDHYSEMGTAPAVKNREDTIYIPPCLDSDFPAPGRQGNKSKRPRVLPLDDETRKVIRQWLLIRPDADRPWLFLSKTNHSRLADDDINGPWHEAFRPDYDETPMHDSVTSHFGRHYFTSWFKIHKDWNREMVEYMRGDVAGGKDGIQGLDHYLHTYYEDIADAYIDEIFKLGI